LYALLVFDGDAHGANYLRLQNPQSNGCLYQDKDELNTLHQ
jgi:hypothetical protein